MANYLKLNVAAILSEQSDYTDPEWLTNWDPYTFSPTAIATAGTLLATTTISIITLSDLDIATAQPVLFALKNTDATNYVQVQWTDRSGTACVARVQAGALLVIPSLDAVYDPRITANSANVICKFLVAK